MKRLRLLGGIVFVVTLLWAAGIIFSTRKAEAAPATFTVTNTNSSGSGSLIQAIQDANSNNNPTEKDTINFNIPGAGPHYIVPPYGGGPTYVTEPITLDGTTQTGSECGGELKIVYDTSSTRNSPLELALSASNSLIKGIVFYDSDNSGLLVSGNYNKVECNYFGLTPDGQDKLDNVGVALLVRGSENHIGGPNMSQRNYLVSNYFLIGVNNTLENNVFGYSVDLAANLSLNTIISPAAGGVGAIENYVIKNNVFQGYSAFNRADPIEGILFIGNKICTNPTGSNNICSSRSGMTIYLGDLIATEMIQFGGSNPSDGNIIAPSVDGAFSAQGAVDNVKIINNKINVASNGTDIFSYPVQDALIHLNFNGLDSEISHNIIAGSSRSAIVVGGGTGHVNIHDNKIFNNTESAVYSIPDIASIYKNEMYGNGNRSVVRSYTNSQTLNDSPDNDGVVNYPVVRELEIVDTDSLVTFDIDLQAGDYRFDICYNLSGQHVSGYGECEQWLMSEDYQVLNSGKDRFTILVPGNNFDVTKMSMQTTVINEYATGYEQSSELGGYAEIAADIGVQVELEESVAAYMIFDGEDLQVLNIDVCNEGPDTIESFELEYEFENLEVNNFIPSLGVYDNETGIWQGQLESSDCVSFNFGGVVGESGKIEATVNLLSSTLQGGYTNNDTNLDNNSDYGESLIIQPADISLSGQRITPMPITAGNTVQYELTVTNNGPGTLSGTDGAAYYINIPASTEFVGLTASEGYETECQSLGDITQLAEGEAAWIGYTGELIVCAVFSPDEIDLPPNSTYALSLNILATSDMTEGQDVLRALLFKDDETDPDMAVLFEAIGSGFPIFDVPINNIINLVYGVNDTPGTPSFDSDPIPDSVEDAAPGNGDGNNDGTPDSEQSNVTSLPIPSGSNTGTYVTLVVPEGSTITTTAIEQATTLATKDSAYNYPLGLISFTVTTITPGSTIPIELYYYTNQSPSAFTPRKHNTNTNTYTTLSTQTQTSLTQTTINNQPVLKLSYQLTDGGPLDQDGVANGTIVDPVGLAQASVGVPETGL